MTRDRGNDVKGVPNASPEDGPASAPTWLDWIDPRKVGWLRVLLVFLPVTIVGWLLDVPGSVLFVTSAAAIIPLAGLIGEATEVLAEDLGPGIGGLLNATFGNAAELIIALFALSAGLDEVVKASITGSVIGNVLLVLGASLFAGGIKHSVQRFNRTTAGASGTLMVLAAIGMLVPALFHRLVGEDLDVVEHRLSFAVSIALMLAYLLNLLFSLVTHRDLYNKPLHGNEPHVEGGIRSIHWRPVATLLVATAAVAWMSEILVGAVEEASEAVGMTQVFVGVFVVAIVGNAAEHSSAVWMAMKNRMDLAVGIAMGSALQIALFVAPVLVFLSHLRPEPMDLLFSPMEVAAVILSVLVARMVCEDGESNWLEGAMLLLLYVILGMAFYFLPTSSLGIAEGPPERHRAAGGDLGRDPVRRPGASRTSRRAIEIFADGRCPRQFRSG